MKSYKIGYEVADIVKFDITRKWFINIVVLVGWKPFPLIIE
jgi:hypothetical protein